MEVAVCMHQCVSVCVIPNVRQIIWSAALKQKGSGPVYSHGEATLAQERGERRELVGLTPPHYFMGGSR